MPVIFFYFISEKINSNEVRVKKQFSIIYYWKFINYLLINFFINYNNISNNINSYNGKELFDLSKK